MKLWTNNSRTGVLIAQTLNINTRDFRTTPYKCINWGCGTHKKVSRLPVEWLNNREAVDISSDKVETLKMLKDDLINVPEFTENKHIAIRHLNDGGKPIYCRTLTRASEGRGIVYATTAREVVDAPLYTVKVNFDYEYRVHVFKGEVLGVMKKLPHEDYDERDINFEIRNHNNGWRFSLCDTARVHETIKNTAIESIDTIGLDFGAVDIAWNRETETATVFEINSAPGIDEDSTIFNKYIDRFNHWLNGTTPLKEFEFEIKMKGKVTAETLEKAKEIVNAEGYEGEVVFTTTGRRSSSCSGGIELFPTLIDEEDYN